MDKSELSTLSFDHYIINYINFEFNQSFDQENVELEVDTKVDTSIDSEINKGITSIEMRLWEEAEEKNKPFSLRIKITGYFSSEAEVESEDFAHLCKYNGSAILFPFLRSAIADLTKTANVPPLVLPLINIKNLVEEKEK